MSDIKQFLSNERINSTISETKESIRTGEVEFSEELFLFIKELSLYFNDNNLGRVIITSDIGDLIDFNNPNDKIHEGSGKIQIVKSSSYFITEKGFEQYINSIQDFETKDPIRLYFIEIPFATLSRFFIPLLYPLQPSQVLNATNSTDTIKFVKPLDFKSQQLVTRNIENWLVEESELPKTPISWQVVVSKKLLVTLAAEVAIENNLIKIEFKGDRRKSISIPELDRDKFISTFKEVNEIANWIYYQNIDTDTRHALFNQQICLLLEDDAVQLSTSEFKRKLIVAYQNSLLAYRYYLSSSSKELQKTLSELNRTLFDYVSKIRQNTSDLSTSLWRDFTTAFGVMILNFLLKKQDIISGYFQWFAVAISLYVLVSFFIIASSGFWFYYGLKQNVSDWRNKLYSYLSDVEYNDLAEGPLKSAFKKFRLTFWIVLISYTILIIGILSLVDNFKPFFRYFGIG